MHLTALPLIITFIFTLSMGGCATQQPISIGRSLHEYNNGQWVLSRMWAQKSISSHQNIDEAQYMMGLCEFKLGNLDHSKQWFDLASQSANTEVHAKSSAMLGIIATSKGDYETASKAFSVAAPNLIGSDQQQAYSRSISPSTGTAVVPNNFTLQFGAYRSQENADAAIKTLQSTLDTSGLGIPWIKEELGRLGRTMFLVQAGHFPSRTTASLRKNRGDLPQCIVAATP